MVQAIQAIGAVPIWTGHVPLTDWARSADYQRQLSAVVGDGAGFPGSAGASP